jgi:predicted CXXCH cytochrome family protein
VGGALDETMFVPVAPTGAEDDANFWANGLERKHRQQYITWSESRHALALTSLEGDDPPRESCLGCHSTDYATQDRVFEQDVVTNTNMQFGVTCVSCHAPHGEAEVEDQLTQESYNLCVSCHTGTRGGTRAITVGSTVHHDMREMYEGRQFLGLGPNPSPHFSNELYGPVCATCHMPGTAASAEYGDIASHSFQVLLPTDAVEGQLDSCTTCHNMSHDDMTPEDLTFFVESTIEDNKARIDEIRATLDEINVAHPEWDPRAEEKSDEQLTALRIHTLVSFVESDGSWGFHNPDYADEILSESEDLLDELLDMLGM